MELTVHDNHGVTVVKVSGEMDAGNSTQLGEVLDHLLTEGIRKLVIDLGKVGFMNSSGLATLVRYYKRARSNCRDISLAALQPAVRQVFQLNRLDRVFELQPDVAKAVQRFIGPEQAPSATTKASRQRYAREEKDIKIAHAEARERHMAEEEYR
jgi:anti-sigma B factor antagonist